MAVAEGNTYKFKGEEAIDVSVLESFAFASPKQYIKTETKEFSAVCPFSGLPDIAKVRIEYYPEGGKCVELKSLKYYMISYRDVGIYQEAATKRMYDDLTSLLETTKLKVTTMYEPRGGFYTTCIEGSLD